MISSEEVEALRQSATENPQQRDMVIAQEANALVVALCDFWLAHEAERAMWDAAHRSTPAAASLGAEPNPNTDAANQSAGTLSAEDANTCDLLRAGTYKSQAALKAAARIEQLSAERAEAYDTAVNATSRAMKAEARAEAMLRWLDNNTTFYDVDADYPVEGHNIPTLAQVSERIWYHATDDIKSWPFSVVIDAALAAERKPTGR